MEQLTETLTDEVATSAAEVATPICGRYPFVESSAKTEGLSTAAKCCIVAGGIGLGILIGCGIRAVIRKVKASKSKKTSESEGDTVPANEEFPEFGDE